MKKASMFSVGKFYQHKSGQQIHVCAIVNTILDGERFFYEVGWTKKSRPNKAIWIKIGTIPIDEKTIGWKEINEEKFVKDNGLKK
jgi:hypothetical protein